jgi:hypothetical protein
MRSAYWTLTAISFSVRGRVRALLAQYDMTIP